jgi:3-hydroxyisobutyrate dehydrogenase-like beta-hydroxyacid dehydrogenase
MEIGFIGLGGMGEPMASNLLRAGHKVRVFNRTHVRAEALAALGAEPVATAAAACASGVVATMLANDQAVEEVAFSAQGVIEGLPAGGVHISHSTISTQLWRRLAEVHRQKGQNFVAAPVFGRPEAAQAARLVVVAAGPAEAVERCRPALESVGRKLFVIGSDPPAANTFKLVGNFLIMSMLESLAESFALLRKAEVDPAVFLEVMVGTFFQSPVYENYGKIILEQRFEPAGFKMRLGLKDVRLVLAAAEETSTPMPVASLICDNFLTGLAQGMGDLDWSAIARVAAQRAGLKS